MTGKGDVIFMLDSSTSVGTENFKKMIKFTSNTVKAMDVDSGRFRVGLLTYNTNVRDKFQLNAHTDRDSLLNAIEAMPYSYGNTNPAAAIRLGRSQMFTEENGDRSDVSNIIILVTDGESNMNTRKTIPEAEEARNAGIRLLVVAIGVRNMREIDGMANKPLNSSRFRISNFDGFESIQKQVISSVCEGIYYYIYIYL